MYQLQVGDMMVEVEPKRIRSLRLSIRPPEAIVHVSCPLFCSETDVVAFVSRHMSWIEKTRQKVLASVAKRGAELPISQEEAQRFAWRLDGMLKEALRETGERINGYRIRMMRSEWGSCNPHRKTLVFNLALARMDDECVRYVIIHEICHLRVPNHSAIFWHEVARYCPNWAEIRKRMRNK